MGYRINHIPIVTLQKVAFRYKEYDIRYQHVRCHPLDKVLAQNFEVASGLKKRNCTYCATVVLKVSVIEEKHEARRGEGETEEVCANVREKNLPGEPSKRRLH